MVVRGASFCVVVMVVAAGCVFMRVVVGVGRGHCRHREQEDEHAGHRDHRQRCSSGLEHTEERGHGRAGGERAECRRDEVLRADGLHSGKGSEQADGAAQGPRAERTGVENEAGTEHDALPA